MFKEIKSTISCAQYLEKFHGIVMQRFGNTSKCCCPLPGHDDSTPSFVAFQNGGFYCHGCKESGDVIQLHATIERLGNKEAADDLCEKLNLTKNNRSKSKRKVNRVDVIKAKLEREQEIQNRIQRIRAILPMSYLKETYGLTGDDVMAAWKEFTGQTDDEKAVIALEKVYNVMLCGDDPVRIFINDHITDDSPFGIKCRKRLKVAHAFKDPYNLLNVINDEHVGAIVLQVYDRLMDGTLNDETPFISHLDPAYRVPFLVGLALLPEFEREEIRRNVSLTPSKRDKGIQGLFDMFYPACSSYESLLIMTAL